MSMLGFNEGTLHEYIYIYSIYISSRKREIYIITYKYTYIYVCVFRFSQPLGLLGSRDLCTAASNATIPELRFSARV